MDTSGGGLERIKKLVRDQPQPLEILQITQQLPCWGSFLGNWNQDSKKFNRLEGQNTLSIKLNFRKKNVKFYFWNIYAYLYTFNKDIYNII